jgi:hypothetical protein
MRIRLQTAALLAIVFALTACVQTTTTLAGAPGGAVSAGTATAVSSARAVQLMEAVCGASLPNFANARATMKANGITAPSPTGTPTMYSTTEDASFQIQDGPGLGKTCSMVFGSTDSQDAVLSALSRLGRFQATPFGPATTYRGRGALVIFAGATRGAGSRTYYNIRMFSER